MLNISIDTQGVTFYLICASLKFALLELAFIFCRYLGRYLCFTSLTLLFSYKKKLWHINLNCNCNRVVRTYLWFPFSFSFIGQWCMIVMSDVFINPVYLYILCTVDQFSVVCYKLSNSRVCLPDIPVKLGTNCLNCLQGCNCFQTFFYKTFPSNSIYICWCN